MTYDTIWSNELLQILLRFNKKIIKSVPITQIISYLILQIALRHLEMEHRLAEITQEIMFLDTNKKVKQ